MTVAELFARIGIKVDDAQAKRFHSTLKAVKIGMIAATAAAAGISLAIKKITVDAMAAAVAFKQFETETGASAQELQKWQSVAEQTNQTAESVTSAIKAIVANQNKIKLGQGNISGFQLLGIDPRQDPFKILEELRIKTKGLSDGMKKNILAQMGVGVGLLQTLELTREQFDAMASRAFIISPAAIKTLNKTKSSIDLAARAFKYIKAQIAVGLSPQIEKLTKQFINFIKVNEKGIIEGFKQAFIIVKKFMEVIGGVARNINNLVTSTIGWGTAIKGLIILFTALNLIMMASPIGLIVAGIVLLIGLIEDLYVYSKGGKSLFGVLMERFPQLKAAVDEIMKPIKIVYELMKAFGEGDKFKIDNILDQWGIWGDIIQGIIAGLEKIGEWLNTGDWNQETNEVGDTVGFLHRLWAGKIGLKRAYVDPVGRSMDILKLLAGLVGIGNSNTNNNTNVEINVNGAESPEATAEAVRAEVQRFLNAAAAQRGLTE